jgi:hypothetical protein
MRTNLKFKVEGSLSKRSVTCTRNVFPQAMPWLVVNLGVLNDVHEFLLAKYNLFLGMKHCVKEILEEKSQKEVEH